MSIDIKRRIAEASNINLLAMVRVGWELETQELDGRQCKDCDPELDDDLALDYSGGVARDALVEDSMGNFMSATTVTTGRSSHYKEARRLSQVLMLSIDDMLVLTFEKAMSRLPDGVDRDDFDNTREYIEECVTENLEYPESCYVKPEEQHFDLPYGLKWTRDQSVDGPEIKTYGPTTVPQSFALLTDLFAAHEMRVDVGCSFHVHISVPGIGHTYGKKFQGYLYEYLISQIDRVPKAVRSRWSSSAARYFKAQISEDKMTFVNFHDGYKTWEFRCFGNVSNIQDATACIRLAAEALRYAYQCQLGQATPAEMGTVIDVLKRTTDSPKRLDLDLKSARRAKRDTQAA